MSLGSCASPGRRPEADTDDDKALRQAALDVWLEGSEATTAIERLRGVSATDVFRNPPKWLPQAQAQELRASLLRRRLSVFVEGNTRILFTAPHTLELLRDGQVNHVAEVYTGSLAHRFAKICRGACVTWAEEERQRVKAQGKGVADPDNRDPNYLLDSEIATNPWFAAIRHMRERMAPLWNPAGAMRRCVHIDVHGMKDPTNAGLGKDGCSEEHRSGGARGRSKVRGHCTVGITRQIGKQRALELFQNTKQHLDAVLAPFGMEVRDGWEVGLRGEWARAPRESDGRNTLTQMSSKHRVFAQCGSAPFTHVMQLELSLTLRKMLNAKRQFREAFARALAAAAFMQTQVRRQVDDANSGSTSKSLASAGL